MNLNALNAPLKLACHLRCGNSFSLTHIHNVLFSLTTTLETKKKVTGTTSPFIQHKIILVLIGNTFNLVSTVSVCLATHEFSKVCEILSLTVSMPLATINTVLFPNKTNDSHWFWGRIRYLKLSRKTKLDTVGYSFQVKFYKGRMFSVSLADFILLLTLNSEKNIGYWEVSQSIAWVGNVKIDILEINWYWDDRFALPAWTQPENVREKKTYW